MIKAVALDFDNCIILDEKTRMGSEEVKDEAWFKVFPEIPRTELEPILKKIKKKISGGKGDRKDVVRGVYHHFLNNLVATPTPSVLYIETEEKERCNLYNCIVQEGIKKIGISESTRNSLKTISEKLPLFINTGTPREQVIESLTALEILDYFDHIYGRPGTKLENLQNIITAESIHSEELLFVGDQQSDWIAAQKAGCQFIGIQTKRNTRWDGRGAPFPIIKHLAELMPIMQKI